MGANCSKSTTAVDSSRQPVRTNSDPKVPADLSSYEAACLRDPDLRTFDFALQERTNRVITSIAADVDSRSLSMNSLMEVTGALLEMNDEVVNVILKCQTDIWKNKDLADLVQDYFDTSLKTLEFITNLERCLKRARDTQLILQLALQKFAEERGQEESSYSRTIQELRNFKAAGDPFTEDFVLLFKSVYDRQLLLLKKLQAKKQKLDRKLKSFQGWRKVSNVIFGATFAAVLICSVVAAAVSAPPVVAAVAAAAAMPLGSVGKWLNSIWKKYETEVKEQIELIGAMRLGTLVTIKDMDNIRALVDRLEIHLESLLQTSDFVLRQEEAVLLAINEIEKMTGLFMLTVEELGQQSDKCAQRIRMARTVILRRIMRQPSD